MNDIKKQALLALGSTIIGALILIAIVFFCGCNPALPERADYTDDMYPCYLADLCVRINGFKNSHPVSCDTAMQKCFRYSDIKKCGSDKDCWDKLGIRY